MITQSLRINSPSGETVVTNTPENIEAIQSLGWPYEVRNDDQAVYESGVIIGWTGEPVSSWDGTNAG